MSIATLPICPLPESQMRSGFEQRLVSAMLHQIAMSECIYCELLGFDPVARVQVLHILRDMSCTFLSDLRTNFRAAEQLCNCIGTHVTECKRRESGRLKHFTCTAPSVDDGAGDTPTTDALWCAMRQQIVFWSVPIQALAMLDTTPPPGLGVAYKAEDSCRAA